LATKAVFLDALGTLVELEPPWVTLRAAVPEEVGDEALVAAVREEMAYYKDHAHEGRDEESLADLRRRCAELISDRLGVELSAEALVDSIVFDAYPDAGPALEGLRAKGMKLVVVSNWDCSLGRVLDRCGIAGMVDGVVTSAESGHRKPDPGIFTSALELAGCEPSEALHVGDTPEEDGAGARAAGIPVLLIDRDGEAGEGDRIASLGEIVEHLRR
jgi:putative hydrolase of the HAD superfamily